ncbi:hypothetical protein [Pseudaestuariivita atlantica]|uniref:Energy transducer TonB n=1 Tax=Pseudaestuariivita atlantica TaxID=1317121 RepID=A0A0L1JSQ2_9RHOB|nr:hypothetical protein [Pseudaestuariivita atlantica]KNG94786.1 hypothetical protein ATO11_05190 [Pseudaestuariivita atlantica]
MHVGHYISGIGHAGLIGWLLFGNVFAAEPLKMEFTEVTMVSGQEWAALVLPESPPDASAVVETPEPPAPQPEADPVAPETVPEPQPAPQPDPAPAPAPDAQPDVSDVATPVPEAAVEDAPPDQPDAPAPEVAVIVPDTAPLESIRPKPRPASRVAPVPVAQPQPETEIAPVPSPETRPDEASETPTPEQDAARPEEATTEIVTEAEEPASAAPTQSLRPRGRPERLATASTPEPDTPAPSDTRDDSVESVVADLLREATAPAAPAGGPPLSRGESEAFRIAVQECWNVDVGSQAANVVVTVGFELAENGTVSSDVRLIAAEGGSDGAVQTAFQSARRAVLRCQRGGYDLPADKYETWREVEMTFNPESMRVR